MIWIYLDIHWISLSHVNPSYQPYPPRHIRWWPKAPSKRTKAGVTWEYRWCIDVTCKITWTSGESRENSALPLELCQEAVRHSVAAVPGCGWNRSDSVRWSSAANCPPTAPRCLMLAPTLLKVPNLQPQDASCWPLLIAVQKALTYHVGVSLWCL